MFNNFSVQNRAVYENVEKYCRVGQATDAGYIRLQTHPQNM